MNKKLWGAAALLAMATVMAAGCGGGDKKPAAPAADAKKGPTGEVPRPRPCSPAHPRFREWRATL